MKILCINCHKEIQAKPGILECSEACRRQYSKLSMEAERAAFQQWWREMRIRFDYDNDEIAHVLNLDLF